MQNELYPIFLKVHQLDILLVGGGYVALEKLTFLLKSSPNARITVLAPSIQEEIRSFSKSENIEFIEEYYSEKHLKSKHIVIGATKDKTVNEKIYSDCKKRHILVNIADKPDHCDFYMGGIITKGHLKIGISTNGKSPTVAKRLRQFFEAVIPDNIDDFLENINSYRNSIKGDFEEKLNTLNKLTASLVKQTKKKP